jgi:hypothetical protein
VRRNQNKLNSAKMEKSTPKGQIIREKVRGRRGAYRFFVDGNVR